MSIRILLDHVCPNCRAPREGWEIDGDSGLKADLRPGTIMPAGIEAAEGQEARDRCDQCGQRITGHLSLDDERPQGGPGVRLLTVADLADRAVKIAARSKRRRLLEAVLRREGRPE